MSVLGAAGGNHRQGADRGLREKASEKLSAVGKSIWGYFSSAKERVRSNSGRRSRGNSDNPSASKQTEEQTDNKGGSAVDLVNKNNRQEEEDKKD